MDTKDTILKKTFQLLLQKGYDAVSISDIQKATGLSRGILYHYFGNKEALFVEVTREYFMNWFYIDLREIADFDVEAMIARMESMYRDIFIKSWLEFEQADGISIRNYDFLFYRVMQENKEFEREYMRARETELEAWKIVLRNARRAGKLREGVDPDRTARYFIYLLDGIWLNAVNECDVRRLVSDMKEVIYNFYQLIK